LKAPALLSLLLVSALAQAQSVGLAGMLGGRALLIVDGAPPKTVAAGETWKGVKVISTQGDTAQVSIEGKQYTLHVGDACMWAMHRHPWAVAHLAQPAAAGWC
jgi:aspartyl protease family protein